MDGSRFETDLREFGTFQHALLHRALHRFLILFGKHGNGSGLDTKPDVASFRIIYRTFGDGRTDFMFVTSRREQPRLSYVDGDPAARGINRPLTSREKAGQKQERQRQ